MLIITRLYYVHSLILFVFLQATSFVGRVALRSVYARIFTTAVVIFLGIWDAVPYCAYAAQLQPRLWYFLIADHDSLALLKAHDVEALCMCRVSRDWSTFLGTHHLHAILELYTHQL